MEIYEISFRYKESNNNYTYCFSDIDKYLDYLLYFFKNNSFTELDFVDLNYCENYRNIKED